MKTLVRALIIDDDAQESAALADLLKATGDDLQVEVLQPLENVEGTAKAARNILSGDGPRIMLLDYRLEDHRMADGRQVTYRGGTVAGYIRDQEPDLPIVLLTSEAKLHEWVERRPGMKQVFDWTLLKVDVSADREAPDAHARIVDFACSWEKARGWPDDTDTMWRQMEDLMSAPAGGITLFSGLEAEPPRGDVTGDILHWLLHRALRFPGPLLGGAGTRVTLGIVPDAFRTQPVMNWLEESRYNGALRAFGDRWWAHLVRGKLADAAGGRRPLDASARAAVLSETVGTTLQSEGCSWCGGDRTLQACVLCEAATDAAHCVRQLTEPLPAWADPWVVCYRCIAEGRAESVHFPPASQEIVDALTEDRIRPPEE